MLRLTLGHSPDPDDAFMFYALAKGLIDSGDIEFEHILQDIETLNRRATRGELDVTAISVHAYAHVHEHYALLTCGASIGEKYGPLVVARESIPPAELPEARIAIPGTLTTAYLALRLAIGPFKEVVMPFDEILDAVEAGRVDAGLIIHEGQLTYERRALRKVIDLGEWWYEETQLPLPLGVNGVAKRLGRPLMERVAVLVRASIDYGLCHRAEAVRHSLAWGRGLDEALADRFVGMYVNDFTVDMGERGRRAIDELLARAWRSGLIADRIECEFVAGRQGETQGT
jgi:1,4-dihydroxy-6-naphthoate synthase